jgi:hypothetical protein
MLNRFPSLVTENLDSTLERDRDEMAYHQIKNQGKEE